MKSIFLALLAIIAVASSSIAQDTWTQKADFGATARYGAVGFSIGNKGYIGTGLDGNSTIKKDFWEYDPDANIWTQKADFGGSARESATGFSIGSKGYIGTGWYGHEKKDFWEYDPALNSWIQKADFGGSARYDATSFSIGSKGYIGTGHNNSTDKKDFWEYDPEANKWTKKADFGGDARSYATGFSIGNKGYAGTGLGNGYKKDFWEYDPNTNTWTQKADLGGSARYGATGFNIGGKGYIGTGDDNTYTLKKDVWEYDPDSNTWTQKTDFGGGVRVFALGFIIGSKGYLGTGYSYDGNDNYYNDFWAYTPNGSSCSILTVKITPQGNLDICTTEFVNLIASEGNNYSYHWNRNNNDIPGATNQFYHATKTGNYRVRVVDSLGCHGVSKKVTVYTSCKLDEQQSDALASEMKLYPNPSNGQFVITITLPEDVNRLATVQVINTLGQVVHDETTSVMNSVLQKEIQLNDAADGMYLVKVIINDQVYSSQISYQR